MRNFRHFSPFSALCGLVLGASALLPMPENGVIAGWPPLCPFHHLTGLPCPGCGLTRAFVACAHGQIAAAFRFHPLGPILWTAALFLVINSLLGRATPRLSNRSAWIFTGVGAIFWVLRLSGVFPLPAA